MQLRAPSIAAGNSAFWWAFTFAVYVWAFMLSLGISNAMAVLSGLLTLAATFMLIRTQGRKGRPAPTRRRRSVRP
jgi:hypothetical protein